MITLVLQLSRSVGAVINIPESEPRIQFIHMHKIRIQSVFLPGAVEVCTPDAVLRAFDLKVKDRLLVTVEVKFRS